ncbi:MAG: PAS domain S-box protein [Deltaproteobacteria bacterium]|nr:PAS domain S-box protein [Deltaproteobacteria bacterium]
MSPRVLPMAFVEAVDMVGSATMILLAVLSVHQALILRRKDPQNIMWTYLVWFCSGLLVFAFSRSFGHIVKHALLAADLGPVWRLLKPVSGSLNTITFVIAGAITLFFSRVYRTYQRMLLDKTTIEKAHDEIAQLNVNLEKIVESRTRELGASEEKYRRVFENSKDMLFICDEEGTILDMNFSGVEMLGFQDRGDLVGQNLFKEFFLDQAVAAAVRNGLEEKGFLKDVELRLKTKKGNEYIVLFSGTVTRGGEGLPAGFEGIVKDITSRKQMEIQLLQADKLASLGQLSAGIAHEINNPLGLVLGYTRLILKEIDPATPITNDLKVIEKHALNCKKIVENLLRFSRATSTTKSPVNLNQLIQEMIAVVENKFNLEKVQVESHLAPDLPPTMADPDKMGQVFMNILMNARQAMERAGIITVSSNWDPETRHIRLSFEDTGSGIPPEILHKIFDPFFTTKPVGMGTGLGLAVSYGIVKDHEGEIRVESTPGEGSRFTVDLPIQEPEEGKTSLKDRVQ